MMIRIFSVLKCSLHEMGICYNNEQNPYFNLAKNVVVLTIFGVWLVLMFIATIVSDNLSVKISCFFVFITCLFIITIYVYILCNKSKLFNLVDELEKSINESKLLEF